MGDFEEYHVCLQLHHSAWQQCSGWYALVAEPDAFQSINTASSSETYEGYGESMDGMEKGSRMEGNSSMFNSICIALRTTCINMFFGGGRWSCLAESRCVNKKCPYINLEIDYGYATEYKKSVHAKRFLNSWYFGGPGYLGLPS